MTSPTNEPEKPVSGRILVIDDEPGFRALLSHELGLAGYQVTTASNGQEALEKAQNGKFDLAISDFKMPKLGGLEFLDAIKKEDPNIEVIIATGFGTIETAVSAMKKGAYDFVQKPFNLPEVMVLVEKALEKRDLKALLGVYESSKAIYTSIKLDALIPIVMQLAIKILKADDASLMLKQEDGMLKLVSSLGLENDQRKETLLAVGERVAGKAHQWKGPVLISGGLQSDPRFQEIPQIRNIRSSLVCPLEIDGKFLGVLSVNRTGDNQPFTPADLCGVTILGSQIAQAVYNATLYGELEKKVSELRLAYDQLEEAQSKLVQSEKLAAIGQLAAGVAHELNNPLTGILGFSEMVLKCDTLPPQVREDVKSINTQSKRCREIIQNLLQFSRRREPHQESVDIVPLLEATLRLVRYDFINSNIEIATDYDEDLPAVFADPSQLQQVFLNLITNARQAMEKSPTKKLTLLAKKKGQNVVLRFSDTGSGIAPEILGKIFDPFFTTKPVNQGTGLGLSISYGIIEQHHGKIQAESPESGGTTFIVELPAFYKATQKLEIAA
jgi:signal transduction histidine kinase/ActR/RegA family two-component response regulator